MGNCFPGTDTMGPKIKLMDNPSPGGTNRGIDNDERAVQAQGRALDAIAGAILTECSGTPAPSCSNAEIHVVRHGESGVEIPCGPDGKTKVFAFVREGARKRCQDAVVVCTNIGGVAGQVMVAVCDGHGPFGHHTSNMVRDTLPLRLTEKLAEHNPSSCAACTAGPPKKGAPVVSCAGAAITSAYAHVERQCMAASEGARNRSPVLAIGMDCSGTTCVSVMMTPGRLLVSGCGDSRVVLGTVDGKGASQSLTVSRDHKPLVGEERRRVEAAGARIFSHVNEPHIPRVWLPDADAPGLAMTRAFGDACLKPYGLTAEPDVFERQAALTDDHLILASDGIWDVVSNAEAVKVVRDSIASGRNPCEALVDFACNAWRVKYPTSVVDDMGVIVVRLAGDMLKPPPPGMVTQPSAAAA